MKRWNTRSVDFIRKASASPSYPHLQFSGPVTSSVTHSPVILGNRTRAPYTVGAAAAAAASTSPGDSYLSGSVTSSVTQPPVIPRYSYPYGNRMRAPLLALQPQSASPGDSFISGPITSSVTQPSVIRGLPPPKRPEIPSHHCAALSYHLTLSRCLCPSSYC